LYGDFQGLAYENKKNDESLEMENKGNLNFRKSEIGKRGN
jgi:hypothetical protein